MVHDNILLATRLKKIPREMEHCYQKENCEILVVVVIVEEVIREIYTEDWDGNTDRGKNIWV